MGTPTVAADEREVHPVLWAATGVAEAAQELDAARRAPHKLREQRRLEHAAWRDENRRNALKKGWSPAPEPPSRLDHHEEVRLRQQLKAAEAKLEAVVAANAEDVVEGLKAWEAGAMRRVRDLVSQLEGICRETALAGRALSAVGTACGQVRVRQPSPKVEDLVYLAGKAEDVALVDFQDGRPQWLQVTGRA